MRRTTRTSVMALLAAAAVFASLVTASPAAAVDNGRIVFTVSGKAASVAVAHFGLLDGNGIDVLPTHCTTETSASTIRHTCEGLPFGSYTPTLMAPPTGVGASLSCAPVDVAAPVGDPLVAVLDETSWDEQCGALVWPDDGSGPVDAEVWIRVHRPATFAGSAELHFLDHHDVDRLGEYCTLVGTTTALGPFDEATHRCTPTAGTYRLHIDGAAPNVDSDYRCTGATGVLPSADIVISSATFDLTCDLFVGPPTLIVFVTDSELAGTFAGVDVAVHPAGQPDAEASCVTLPGATATQPPQWWMCGDLAPGEYRIVTNLADLGLLPDPLSCRTPPSYSAVPTDPIVVGTDGLRVIQCVAGYVVRSGGGGTGGGSGGGTGGGGTSGTGSTHALPDTGAATFVPAGVAALVVALGTLLRRAARRPLP